MSSTPESLVQAAGLRALRGWHLEWATDRRDHDHPVTECPDPMFASVLADLSVASASSIDPVKLATAIVTQALGYDDETRNPGDIEMAEEVAAIYNALPSAVAGDPAR